MENALCRRRRRDFHAFCVHSFWAGSCFVFKNLLVTHFSQALSAFQLCGFFLFFFPLQVGLSQWFRSLPCPPLPGVPAWPLAIPQAGAGPGSQTQRGTGGIASFQRTRWESQRPHSGAEQPAGAGWPSTRNSPSQGCGGEVGWYAGLERCCRSHAAGQCWESKPNVAVLEHEAKPPPLP